MPTPSKLTLESRTKLEATVRVEGTVPLAPVVGIIRVECSTAQAFAEILNYLVHIHEAISGIQAAISFLGQIGRFDITRTTHRALQQVHHLLTGWHYPLRDSLPLDNPPKEAIIPSKEPFIP